MEIELDRSPSKESIANIYDGLIVFNEAHFPGHHEEKLALYVRMRMEALLEGLCEGSLFGREYQDCPKPGIDKIFYEKRLGS